MTRTSTDDEFLRTTTTQELNSISAQGLDAKMVVNDEATSFHWGSTNSPYVAGSNRWMLIAETNYTVNVAKLFFENKTIPVRRSATINSANRTWWIQVSKYRYNQRPEVK